MKKLYWFFWVWMLAFLMSCSQTSPEHEEVELPNIGFEKTPITYVSPQGEILNPTDEHAKEVTSPFICLVNTLTNEENEWAYHTEKYSLEIPDEYLDDPELETRDIVFRIAARNAHLRASADSLEGGGVVRFARCKLPDSPAIISAVEKKLGEFDQRSWMYTEVKQKGATHKQFMGDWVYMCTAVIDHFWCDRPNVPDPYNDSGCTYSHSTCVEYSWVYVDDGDGGGGGGGIGAGSGDSDPCAACDPDGAGICTNQESGGVPQSCAIDFNVSVITDPCQLANLLEDDAIFRSYMLMLVSDANNKDRETAWTFYKDGNGNPHYQYHQGPVGGDHVDLTFTQSIDGAMHQHYDFDGAFSIFSSQDMKALYEAYVDGNINNLATFTYGLVTHHGTRYMLKVDDVQALINFFSNNFSTKAQFDSFNADYNLYRFGYIFGYGEVIGGRLAFLRLLEEKNSGLKLFEANANFTSWTAKKRHSDGQSVINDNCN